MSVQAGIWNFDGRPVDRKLLADISESLKQQGPDGEFRHVDGSVAILYRPFHTTAESRREKQPYRSQRGFIVTWDGRLDNRDEIIPELSRDLEANPTDVAIVAAAFDRWETDCFRRIVGDWAISVWKAKQLELILAVDFMAIRHIFYYLREDRMWWSTDLATLVLISGEKFNIDDDYIAGYFANDPDAYRTPYLEIREAPPGQIVAIRNGVASFEKHWSFSSRSRIHYETDVEYQEHFCHILRQSVRRRLRTDTPVIAELSGGLDSTSIVCIADNILRTERSLAPRLDSLSFFDKTEPDGDDWTYFQKVEQKRGRVGSHIDTSRLQNLPSSLGYPFFDPLPGSLNAGSQLDSERASLVKDGGYRVALSGFGGDEFLGGIPDPRPQLADSIVQLRLLRLAAQLVAWSMSKRQPAIQLLWQSSIYLLPPFLRQYFAKHAQFEDWIDEDFATRLKFATRRLECPGASGFLLPTRRAYSHGCALMAAKMAKRFPPRMAMEEARYPYLDRDLIEFVMAIPADQLLRPGERRSLMRRSLIGCVPEDIRLRRTKGTSMRTPLIVLEKAWEELRATFDSPLSSNMGYINQSRFLDALDTARNGKTTSIAELFRTISLEFWLRDMMARGLLAGKTPSPLSSKARGLRANTAGTSEPAIDS